MALTPPETVGYWAAGLAGVIVGSFALLVVAHLRGW